MGGPWLVGIAWYGGAGEKTMEGQIGRKFLEGDIYSRKSAELGAYGEEVTLRMLEEEFPTPRYCVFSFDMLDIDAIVVDTEMRRCILFCETKTTTTKGKEEFVAGNVLQLAVAKIQRNKKAKGGDWAPYRLVIHRVSGGFWEHGDTRVLETKTYDALDSDVVEIGEKGWTVRGRDEGRLR